MPGKAPVPAEPPHNSVTVTTRAQWRAWLTRHHTRAEGLWLVTYKKAVADKYVDYEAIVEEALCFGWIDSKSNKLDAQRSMLWLAPRKAGTGWSRPNKQRIARLTTAGLMHPAGIAKIEQAKRDGSWSALDAIEELAIPGDLARAFAQHHGARANFEAFPRSVKRGILEWIAIAKKAQTRAKRVDETARLAHDNVRANQWRK
jgi:uncharacterized protein YdeI (YjbR/CyaY-like superfamily)